MSNTIAYRPVYVYVCIFCNQQTAFKGSDHIPMNPVGSCGHGLYYSYWYKEIL